MPHPDVVVIGGGIVGASCARELARRGAAVQVVEAGQPGAATPASAGMLGPLAETAPDDPMLSLYVRGRDRYRTLATELKEETGKGIGLWTDGIYQVAFSDDEAAEAKGAIAWLRQQGLHFDWIDAPDLHQRSPGLSPAARGAVFAPEDGAVDPVSLLAALRLGAEHHGVTFFSGEPAESVIIEHGRATGIKTAAGNRPAGAVLVACGAWAGQLKGLPRPLAVEPLRGQMLAVEWPKEEPGAILYAGVGYVLQRGSEGIVGSTMEYAGFTPTVTDEGVQRLMATLERFYPGLKGAAVKRTWAGLRPQTPDGRPYIGAEPKVPNLFYAVGHGRVGVLLGAVTGQIIAQLWAGEEVGEDLAPVAPGRFWRTMDD